MPQAIPGVSVSTPPAQSRAGGLLRVVSPAALDEADRLHLAEMSEANRPPATTDDLGAYIRERWMAFRNHRNQGNDPLVNRLLRAQRMFDGRYDSEKLSEIEKFGGSKVYSRLVAVKARGATSLLRDVYLGADRPWSIDPEPDPPIPASIVAQIHQLVATEVASLEQMGQPAQPEQAQMRVIGLMHAAQQAARRSAMTQASAAADKVEDILREGGFYTALAEFLVDLPLFPFACLKGPSVRMVPQLTWLQGRPIRKNTPQLYWQRVSPFDLYWTPGVSNIADADIIERRRYTRADLNDLLGLPGYDQKAVRAVLQDYARGLRDWMDSADTEQALNEGREDPNLNRSHMIDGIEFHGNIQGHMLLENGVAPSAVPDPDRDYAVQSWVVGRHVLKTQINPSPRQRHPYFVTSFEKVPGTVAGHGLADILEDLQEASNATLRSLVNNMAMASGPQVAVNTDILAPDENADELYPWKRWHLTYEPSASMREPITFFQPDSHAQELLTVYQQLRTMADDDSAIPKYATGGGAGAGAGRTASGLSMLMSNASKVLQTVASNIDDDVMHLAVNALYDMIMLTDTSGLLTGQEHVVIKGVNVAIQRETEHQKQLQFLQITANPIDAPIVGEIGRARLLRALSEGLGLPDDIVPDDQTLQTQLQAQKQAQAAAAALQQQSGQQTGPDGKPANKPGGAQGGPAGGPPGGPPGGPAGGPPGGPPGGPATPGAQAAGGQAPMAKPSSLSDQAPPVNNFQAQPGVMPQ